MVWEGVQRLTRGWLSSRTPTQYLTISSREADKRLIVEPGTDNLSIKNELGTGIKMLIVEDHDGKIYMGEQIQAGSSVALAPKTQVQAMLKLRTLFSNNDPQFPPGTIESLALGSGIELMPFSQNLMETQLSAITSAATKGWGAGTYVAVTDRGVHVSLGIEDITEDSSFHVIRGVW
jgi:hypothetical protein